VKPLKGYLGISLILALLLPVTGRCQLTPAQVAQIRGVISDRIEALTIFGGDYLVGGGTFHGTGNGTNTASLNISKFGGSGEFGNLQQLGDLGIAWRPRVMGDIGVVNVANQFTSGVLDGDVSKSKTFSIQFGGGARFWFTDDFSLAPTVMGMYGHSTNEYTANSAFMRANLPKAQQEGLVDFSADTWTVRPALNVQYVYTWDRTLITLSSEPTYLRTQTFKTSNPKVEFGGDSEVWGSKLDVDVPLSHLLFGHELRTGGYYERTELYGDIKEGLNTGYLNEVHGRVVLDFLNQLWLTQWIGLGGSYYWGSNFTGWSAGIDFMLVF